MQDIYYAENKIVKSLPEMIENATDAQLKSGLKAHLGETKGHVQRLEQVFQMLGTVDCPAIDGIIDEAEEVTGEVDDKNPRCRDYRRRAGGRTLRDHPLRVAHRLG